MAHITALGAAMFAHMAVAVPATPIPTATLAGYSTAGEFDPLFATEIPSQGGVRGPGTFVVLGNVREFPAIGTPANVVKVPEYGSKTSKQIQGQADPTNMELKLNYVPANWAKDGLALLGGMVGDGKTYALRFSLLNVDSTGTGATKLASSATGLGTVENTNFYYLGRIEAIQVTPNLTDTTQATLTLTLQSETFGGFTVG